jgi:phosphoglycerate dehydrogenase-like enzyme
MRVLIADKFEQSGRDGLQAIGCEVSFQPDLKDALLVEAIREQNPDVLVVRGTKVTEPMLAAGQIKLVVRAGAGYNTIDVAAASRRGIYVSNCPGKNSIAVAELAFGLILALDRRIADNIISLREGKWNKKEFSKARGLYGRTLGLVGVGRIGQEMIPRARSFGMPVIAWSRSLKPERAMAMGAEYKTTPADVAREADIVSVHVALNADTRAFLNTEFFAAMKEGAYFINTARGEVVDQAALVAAMNTRGIRAGLDVYAGEPTSATAEFTDEIRTFTARITSGRRRPRRKKPLPLKQSASCVNSKTRERSPMLLTSRGKHPLLTGSSYAIWIAPESWHQCLMRSRANTLMFRRWRTLFLRAQKQPWPESIWTTRRLKKRSIDCRQRTLIFFSSICSA